MTALLYQTDSYLKRFEARVVDVHPREPTLVLDRTAFYPGGGGQPCDFGWLGWNDESVRVSRVQPEKGSIWHWIEGSPPSRGATVQGNLDWERRYQLMRTHTALHVLCGVVWRDYGAQVTGGNMEPLKGRLDFEFERMQRDLVAEIEQKINHEISREREVRVQILPRDEAFQIPDLIRTKINLLPKGIRQIRTVEIVGLDLQADGGTHVSNTREIGTVEISGYKSKGRINKRIQIAVS